MTADRQEQLAASLRDCMGIIERLVWLADSVENEGRDVVQLGTDSKLVKDARTVLLYSQYVMALAMQHESDENIKAWLRIVGQTC
jgi:hypothetical protein